MNRSNKVELLCPAKNYDTGIAAINHGADAVYIGATSFGAREAASNSLQDIEQLVKYAHLYHAKVYITINTILFDNELNEVQMLIRRCYDMGIDAIIIQDMGILEMELPPIAIHASTQTNNTSLEKVKFLQDIGLQRVILARELSIKEIASIRAGTNIELEAFIHGALCVSYSGQCYFSQAITSRSANRGKCSQPCRSNYTLTDSNGRILLKDKHLLSLKDFNQTNSIKQLLEAGVTSLKVEGRLKDLGYVKNITAHYRQIIDSILEGSTKYKKSSSGKCNFSFTPDPERTFSRDFTSYFATGRSKGMASFNTPKSVGKKIGSVKSCSMEYFSIKGAERVNNNDGLCFFSSNGGLTGIKVNRVEGDKVYPSQPIAIETGTQIYRNYDHSFNQLLSGKNTAARQIDATINLSINKNHLELSIVDEDGHTTSVITENCFDPARKSDEAKITIEKQLSKTGNSAICISKVNISNLANMPFIPLVKINALRRDLIEKHKETRIMGHKIQQYQFSPNNIPFIEKTLSYKANVSNKLATRFYQRHGVKSIDNAFELLEGSEGIELMTTRYCILFEMGLCKENKRQGEPQTKYFLHNNNRKYLLTFNCSQCNMTIKTSNE